MSLFVDKIPESELGTNKTTAAVMAGKPALHYWDARGRMECIRW
ncbi:hypothetical protein U0070_026840, partial [Myodes glareolus]